MNNISRRSFGGLALAGVIGVMGAGSIVASSETSASASTLTASKLASYNYHNDGVAQTKNLKIVSSSVLTDGANATIIVTFNKNISRDILLKEVASYKGRYASSTIVVQRADMPNDFLRTVHYDITSNSIGYDTIYGGNTKDNPNVHYNGANMMIDLPSKWLPMNSTIDFGVSYSVSVNDSDYYESGVKTKNFVPPAYPHDK